MSSTAGTIAMSSAISLFDPNLKSNSRKRITDGVDDYATPKLSPKRKKSSSKSEKSKWKRVASVMIKNGILLAVLFLLGQIIWKWDNLSNSENKTLFSAPLVGQISDVKEKTEMLQARLKVIESKIEREIATVKEELEKVIKEKSKNLEKKLAELEARGDRVEASLIKLKDLNFLSREELPRILEELKISRITGEDSKGATLDEIRKQARDIIMNEIEKHAADGLGRADYALASGGGRVVRHSKAFNSGKSGWISMGRAFPRLDVHPNAIKMLQPSFGEPGQCFALRGSTGFVEIKLRTAIILEAVTLEHVAKSVGYDRSSAPKECRISAWHERDGHVATAMGTVAEFVYDLEKSNTQTVEISSGRVGTVNIVRLDFLSNHGNTLHTCLYRLRVHGFLPDPV